ncbi:unnamed protein product [Schistosoma curassoni]|uniref:Transposase n=1 Tax=Schistosoma curassoni TaxID=6186 RepID=A0A183JHU6_9TREM|nr:unnamed protein product [Schistosoma curassoni]
MAVFHIHKVGRTELSCSKFAFWLEDGYLAYAVSDASWQKPTVVDGLAYHDEPIELYWLEQSSLKVLPCQTDSSSTMLFVRFRVLHEGQSGHCPSEDDVLQA